eukprot:4141163-Pleurochrysis_carterae.AAC.1
MKRSELLRTRAQVSPEERAAAASSTSSMGRAASAANKRQQQPMSSGSDSRICYWHYLSTGTVDRLATDLQKELGFIDQ